MMGRGRTDNTMRLDDDLILGARVLVGIDARDTADWLEHAGVLVRNGVVVEVGGADKLIARYPSARISGGENFVVMPGMVNSHHHVGLTPLQLGSIDHSLETWFASRLALREVDLELDTLFSAMEMIASGVTTVQHLQSRAPGDVQHVLDAADAVVGAYRRIGMRVSYSMAFRDQNRIVYGDDAAFVASVPEPLRAPLGDYFARFTLPLEDQVTVFKELRARHHTDGLTKVQLAPANLHWLSDAALETVARLSKQNATPMHMHVVETPYQQEYARRRTGGTAVEYLARFGMLTPALTIGHGVWMSESDIRMSADAGVRVCHNCSSNMRLASGRAPILDMRAAGIDIAIGIDEAGLNDDRDMLQELRLVSVSNRTPGIDEPRLTAAAVLRMATVNGAATTGFAESIGELRPGRSADIVLLDWKAITYPFQNANIPWEDVLVQRAKSAAVHSVMIDGAWVMRDRVFTTVDRDAVLADIADRLDRAPTPAETARTAFARSVETEVRSFYSGYLPRA